MRLHVRVELLPSPGNLIRSVCTVRLSKTADQTMVRADFNTGLSSSQ